MPKAIITTKFLVGPEYTPGDTVRLHGDSGTGTMDWTNPITAEIFDLFPGGAGNRGFGHAPFGHHRFGHVYSHNVTGFGHLPCGHHAFGHGATVIRASHLVTACGIYQYGFKAFDAAGNAHAGTPDTVSVEVHIPPDPPTGLKLTSYNKTTDLLTLAAKDR